MATSAEEEGRLTIWTTHESNPEATTSTYNDAVLGTTVTHEIAPRSPGRLEAYE